MCFMLHNNKKYRINFRMELVILANGFFLKWNLSFLLYIYYFDLITDKAELIQWDPVLWRYVFILLFSCYKISIKLLCRCYFIYKGFDILFYLINKEKDNYLRGNTCLWAVCSSRLAWFRVPGCLSVMMSRERQRPRSATTKASGWRPSSGQSMPLVKDMFYLLTALNYPPRKI